MLVKDIMKTIKECNTNSSVKWSIVDKRKDRIELTNDYDKCVSFEIRYSKDDEGEYFTIVDNHMIQKIDFLMKESSNNKYAIKDFETIEEGFKKSIRRCVHHFNYYY